MEIEHCSQCSVALEESQIGLCDECQEQIEETRRLRERVEQIESPLARRVIGRIMDGRLSGRLSTDNLEIIAMIAENLAARNESSLGKDERLLVMKFRSLNEDQRMATVNLISAFKPN